MWITQCLFNVCLVSLNIKFCNFSHIAANVKIFSYNKKHSVLFKCHFFFHCSSVNGALSLSYCKYCCDNRGTPTPVFNMTTPFSFALSNVVSGLGGRCIPHFIGNNHSVFCTGCSALHLQQFYLFSTSLSTHAILCLFDVIVFSEK